MSDEEKVARFTVGVLRIWDLVGIQTEWKALLAGSEQWRWAAISAETARMIRDLDLKVIV